MPLLGILIIFYSNSYISLLPGDIKRIIVLVISANTLGLPLLMMPLFIQFGAIKSLEMESSKERILPMTFMLIPYLLTVYFLLKLPIPILVSSFMIGASIALASCLIISFWWKISIHLVGIGGFVGFLIAFSIRLNTNVLLFILAAILIAGFLASARLYSKAHRPLQVYLGFLLGFIIMLLSIFAL
jgi:membrane-associated phospholipid phosphatase